jgi:RNA polymerase sigma-70 factor (ECF subfamily)
VATTITHPSPSPAPPSAPFDAIPQPERSAGEPADTDLLDAARSGDARAVDELCRRHHRRALSVARRYSSYAYPAEDLAADAMTCMLQALSKGLGPHTSVPAYLAASVRNLSAGAARRRAHAAHASPVPVEVLAEVAASPADLHAPERAALNTETGRELASAFAVLPKSGRLVLELLLVDGLSVEQCAGRLGISPMAVRSMSYRSRKTLRAHLQKTWPESFSAA